jgi:hypothetical protein
MHVGDITGLFDADEASAEGVMACAAGLAKRKVG